MKDLSKIINTAKWANYLSIVVIILLIIFALPARSDGFQSLASVRLQAEAFILQYPYQSPYKPGFAISNLDSRLRLKNCNEPLAIAFSNPDYYFGNTALEIRCPQKPGWKIHLPVRIDVFEDVIVSAKALLKGQLIDDSTIAFEKRNIVRLKNGYFSRNNQLVELQTRRNLARGTVLSPSNLSPRLLVRSGQQVTLILKYKGIEIKSSGQALQSASLGQLVKVRNNQSQKIVEGVVSGDSQVQVRI